MSVQNVRQQFELTDVMRLEVETNPTNPAGLLNYCLNPDGALGGWWWQSIGGTINDSHGPLTYTSNGSSTCDAYSYFVPVTPGEYVSARFDLTYLDTGLNVKAGWIFYNADRAVVNLTPLGTGAARTTTGTYLADAAQVPAGAAYVRLVLALYNGTTGSPGAGKSFAWSNVMITKNSSNTFTTTVTNLCTNPSFETGTSSWSAAYGTISRVTTSPYVGSYCLRSTATSSVYTGAILALSGLTVGKTYTISAYVRGGGSVSFYFTGGNTAPFSGSSIAIATTSSWTRHSFTFTATKTSGPIDLLFYVPGPGSFTGDIDAVLVEQANSADTYFDGSTTDTTSYNYGWTGSANASTSTRTTLLAFDYVPPRAFENLMPDTRDITINRAVLDASSLTATILNPDHDPAVSEDVLRRGRMIRCMSLANNGTTWTPIYTGFIDEVKTVYVLNKDDGTVKPQITVTAYDAAQSLANATSTDGYADLNGLKNTLAELFTVPWNINGIAYDDTSDTPVCHNQNASVLDQVVIARDCVRGLAWVGADGVLNGSDTQPAALGLTFQDTVITTPSTQDSYSDIDVSFATDACINTVNVNFNRYDSTTGDVTQIPYGPYIDQDSVDLNGAYSASYVLQAAAEDPAAIATWAAGVLAANADPGRTVNSITVPVLTMDTIAHVAGVDLCSAFSVAYAALVDQTVRVATITHQITPDGWIVQYGFDPSGSVASPQQTALPPATVNPEFALGSGLDLNTVTVTGSYVQHANANAAAGSNYPVALAGLLEVFTDPARTDMTWQRYTIYNKNGAGGVAPDVWERSYYNGNWSAWGLVLHTEDWNDSASGGSPQIAAASGFTFVRSVMRREGNVVSVLYSCTNNNAISVGAGGNITDVVVGTVNTAWASSSNYVQGLSLLDWSGSCFISGRSITLSALPGGLTTFGAGNAILIGGTYLI